MTVELGHLYPSDKRSFTPASNKGRADGVEYLLNPANLTAVYTNASPLTAVTGWLILAGNRWVQCGRAIHIYFSIQRTGALLTPNANGNFSPGQNPATLNVDVPAPIGHTGASFYGAVGCCWSLSNAGVMTLQGIYPGQTVAVNQTFSGHFDYICA